jgi:hypothetical protein
MNRIQRIADWVSFLRDSRMSRRDREAWASAKGLADLGCLTAAWLEGRLRQTPTHGGPPFAETRPYLDVLTACNRAGFVTDGSQAGASDGWGECRADVSGLTSDEGLVRLRAAVAQTPLILLTRRGRRRACEPPAGWPAIKGAVWASRRDISFFYGEHCPAATAEVRAAWHVTICDPAYGRNDILWPALARFAASNGATP